MIPLCIDQGVGLIPWSPLARGFLAGNRKREGKGDTRRAQEDGFADDYYFREEDWDVLDALLAVSNELGRKPAQVALAWILSVPGVDAAIVGATKLEQMEELAAAVDIELADEHIEKLEAAYKPHPVLGHVQRGPRDF